MTAKPDIRTKNPCTKQFMKECTEIIDIELNETKKYYKVKDFKR